MPKIFILLIKEERFQNVLKDQSESFLVGKTVLITVIYTINRLPLGLYLLYHLIFHWVNAFATFWRKWLICIANMTWYMFCDDFLRLTTFTWDVEPHTNFNALISVWFVSFLKDFFPLSIYMNCIIKCVM